MATPRRTQDRTGVSSTMSASAGHSPRWQYTFAVRGHVSLAFSTSGCDPTGTQSTYGSVESGSGLRAIRNTPTIMLAMAEERGAWEGPGLDAWRSWEPSD